MLWQTFIEIVANVIGFTTEQAGILISLILTLAFMITAAILARRKTAAAMLGTGTVCIVLFLFLGWFPAFIGTILALMFAGLTAYVVKGV